jgi:hypothetical protein
MATEPEYELELLDGNIRYLRSDRLEPLWTLKVEELVLVAEYTTNEGSWLDDWLFVFWTFEQGRLYSCNAAVESGMEKSLADLSVLLGSLRVYGLVQSTEWASRVVWPPSIEGQPYFQFNRVESEGIWERLTSRVFGRTLEHKPAEEVLAYLQAEKARRVRSDAIA